MKGADKGRGDKGGEEDAEGGLSERRGRKKERSERRRVHEEDEDGEGAAYSVDDKSADYIAQELRRG